MVNSSIDDFVREFMIYASGPNKPIKISWEDDNVWFKYSNIRGLNDASLAYNGVNLLDGVFSNANINWDINANINLDILGRFISCDCDRLKEHPEERLNPHESNDELDANGIMAFLEQIKVTDEESGQKRGGD